MGINQDLFQDDKRLKRAKSSGSRRWDYNSVVMGKLDSTADSHQDTEESVFKMGRSSADKVLTFGMTNESDSGGEGGLEQFSGFPGQLVSYPPGSDSFREFCKAKGTIGGKWDKCVEFADRQGIDESISLEYFDGDVRSDLSDSFLCYLSQLEYGLSLRLTNLAKGVMNAIGACLVQMNENMWEVITNFKDSERSYFCASVTRRHFLDLNSVGQTWNDNIIWVKGNCLQRDDEELFDLLYRSIKQSVKSTVERKKSLLDEVAEEETELELVLGELGLSRKKIVEREKVAEGRAASVDDLKEVEERDRLAILQGKEDTSQMIGIEEQESELKKAKSELEKNLARAKTDALKEVKQPKAAHVVVIEVDTIKADAYTEEEEEEADVLGVVDGLDGVSPQTVLDIQGDDVELPEGGSEKVVREMSLRINDLESGLARERETSKALLSAQMKLQVKEKDFGIKKGLKDLSVATERADNLQYQVDALAVKGDDLNVGVTRLKAERDQAISRAKKAEAREHSGGNRTVGHVQKGNANFREYQHKLDAAFIREKVMEGEIGAKDLLVKRKDELLKDLAAREELNIKIMKLRARVVELETINLAELAQYIAQLKEDVIYHDRVDADIIPWKDTCASLKVRLVRLKATFAKAVGPDVARSDLLKVIIVYFVEEVKKLES
ncbi:hypothetical protein GIB67_028173 [Kingdonia uniflora]|uniref:Uncharacterized protein n=1 Tax=Kingdonia uniflora TaxID=39325 RepID=A0A7J7KZZ7_9MAGN|nr:hypothetical protein GIB67_028173 [Kingdonia uniflora]